MRTSEFKVDSVRSYNTMRATSTALPNLQQISRPYLEDKGHKYSDGEDPDEEEAAEYVPVPKVWGGGGGLAVLSVLFDVAGRVVVCLEANTNWNLI